MSIAGIDLNTRAIDIVLIDDAQTQAEWRHVDLSVDPSTGETTGDAFERTRRVRPGMPTSSWWEDRGVIAIGVEQPRGNHGTTPLFRIQGAILASLPTWMLVTPWNPSSWRLEVGLKGNSTKDDITLYALDLLGDQHVAGWPQDAFDAYLIARATWNVVETVPMPP